MDFGPLVKQARKASGYTQSGIANCANVSRTAIVDLENGKGSMSTLAAVSEHIDFRIAGLSRGSSFGEQVKRRRHRLKWTQKKLATKTGLSLPTIRSVENDTGNLDSFSRIIEAIGDRPKPRKIERSFWRGGGRDVRHTPPNLVAAVKKCFGNIHCDPCHDPNSFVEPSTIGITQEMDGLTTRWSGDVAFVNPPFSDLTRWIKRITLAVANKEVQTVIALLPLRPETQAFQDHVLCRADLLLPRGRIRFFSNGKELGPAPFPCVFAIWNGDAHHVSSFANAIDATWLAQKSV
tara:strand:+ start:5339 stop:6214 length:876 start_codon:yes stop_codon:yes gene_type:complete